MKRLYIWLTALFVCGQLFAQDNILRYEYWLDDDYAAKVQTNVAPASTINLQMDILPAMSTGLHTVNFRFTDNSGRWSSTVSSPFYQIWNKPDNTIEAYEYWLDDDFAKCVKGSGSAISAILDFSELSEGIHSFNIRFRDGDGLWSNTESKYFQKLKNLKNNRMVAYEYWPDGRYEEKRSGTITPTQTYLFTEDINANDAMVINFRFMDENGLWSSVVSSEPLHNVEAGFTFAVSGMEVKFTNTSKYADKFIWDFGDGQSSDEENPTHKYTEPGVYKVKLTSQYLELSNSVTHDVEVTGNPDANESATMIGIRIYPNPVEDNLYIENLSQPVVSYSLYSLSGKLMFTSKGKTERLEINMKNYPSGIYILRTETSSHTYTNKIIRK